jgi:hypothetical protein
MPPPSGCGTGRLPRDRAGIESPALAQYERTNLVSDQKENALHRDKVLKNAWGLALASTSPIWTVTTTPGCPRFTTATEINRALP